MRHAGEPRARRSSLTVALIAAFLAAALPPAGFAEQTELSKALFDAVEKDQIEVARQLLERGADVNERAEWGATVLQYIANVIDNPVRDHAAWARLFVEHGADINARTAYGNTPLCLAAENDRQNDLVVYLVSIGADVTLGNEEGLAPLSIATQHACRKNVAVLKARGAPLYSYTFPVDNSAPACKAVLSGDPGAIAAVPAADLSKIVARTSLGVPTTPLHLAVEEGNLAVLRALCARKVDWNVGDRYDRSPLQQAVLAGRMDVAALLLDNGADPNRPDKRSSTAFSWACAARPEMALAFLSRGLAPAGDSAAKSAISAGNVAVVKALAAAGTLPARAADLAATLGQVEIARVLDAPAGTVRAAQASRAAYEQYARDAARPMEAAVRSGGISSRRGTFPYVVESWSPWMTAGAARLEDYPVGVYVPKDYDGTSPYGLFVSMTNAKSVSRYPRDFEKTLDRHHLIWVGFDPYNGLTAFRDANTAFCLAVVHNMLGYFSIDRDRIYIGGYSLGGQMTGNAVRAAPGLFKGMIYINIGYNAATTGVDWLTGWSDKASLYHSRQDVPMVIVEGDYDYNRVFAYADYDALLSGGYRNVHYVQQPMIGHLLISGPTFEKAVTLLDGGPRK